MLLVVATPFSSMLMVFAVVPLGIVAGIYGSDYASHLAQRRRAKRP